MEEKLIINSIRKVKQLITQHPYILFLFLFNEINQLHLNKVKRKDRLPSLNYYINYKNLIYIYIFLYKIKFRLN